MATQENVSAVGDMSAAPANGEGITITVRLFGWLTLATLLIFLVNNYLTNWLVWPGPASAFNGSQPASSLAWIQVALFPIAFTLTSVFVLRTRARSLRDDSLRISNANAILIRMAFFVVLFVGLGDAAISFLRVEGLLPAVVGDAMTTQLSISQYRGVYVHFPLIAAGIITGAFSRTLGFPWLALLAVGAELLIVITRFIFSYEQAFMADLVRFWYAALFLFASAHTLLEEGHVRVDILYAGFNRRAKGRVNAIGSTLLGVTLCWVVLSIGMYGKSGVINSALLAFETTQTGFGMYVKYLMAGFLGIFAISMMTQFTSYFMDAVADWRNEPGGRDHDVHAVQ